MKTCKMCGCEKPLTEFDTAGSYQRKDGTKTPKFRPNCKPCSRRADREAFDAKLEELGVVWKCTKCGYDKCRAALDFHHEQGDKEFILGRAINRSAKALKQELAKGVILCANCHREHHAGM